MVLEVVKQVHSADGACHQRVRVAVLGRYMLADRREYPCQTVDMSPGGVRLTCAVKGEVGERVVLYLEHIGRIEGDFRQERIKEEWRSALI